MPDVVVTIPKKLWIDWILEGDAAGAPATGEEWAYYTSHPLPNMAPGDRVYVVAHGRLRGYAPLLRLHRDPPALVRGANAVAVTVADLIPGFRGWRYRWWEQAAEAPFPDWRTAGVPVPSTRDAWGRERFELLALLDARGRVKPLVDEERATRVCGSLFP